MTKINPEDYINPAAERWLQALESGEYEQGKSKLRDGNKFCCLGIACILSELAEEILEGPDLYSYNTPSTRAISWLPPEVQHELGLYSSKGLPVSDRLNGQLTTLNDTGTSFVQIAELLRFRPDRYFLPISEQGDPQ